MISISYGGNIKTIIFTDKPRTKRNQTFLPSGRFLGDTINGFLETVESASFGFNANQGEKGTILITPNRQTLPRVRPPINKSFKCYSSCKSDRERFDRFS